MNNSWRAGIDLFAGPPIAENANVVAGVKEKWHLEIRKQLLYRSPIL